MHTHADHSRIEVFYEYDTSGETLMALGSIGTFLGVTMMLTGRLWGDSSQSATRVGSVVTVMTCASTSAAVFVLVYGHVTWAWIGSLKLVQGKGTFTAYKQAAGCAVQTPAKSAAAENHQSANAMACAVRPSTSCAASHSSDDPPTPPRLSPDEPPTPPRLSPDECEPSVLGECEGASALPSAARATPSPYAGMLARQLSRKTSGAAISITRTTQGHAAPQDADADEMGELDDSGDVLRSNSAAVPPAASRRSGHSHHPSTLRGCERAFASRSTRAAVWAHRAPLRHCTTTRRRHEPQQAPPVHNQPCGT